MNILSIIAGKTNNLTHIYGWMNWDRIYGYFLLPYWIFWHSHLIFGFIGDVQLDIFCIISYIILRGMKEYYILHFRVILLLNIFLQIIFINQICHMLIRSNIASCFETASNLSFVRTRNWQDSWVDLFWCFWLVWSNYLQYDHALFTLT